MEAGTTLIRGFLGNRSPRISRRGNRRIWGGTDRGHELLLRLQPGIGLAGPGQGVLVHATGNRWSLTG